MIVSLTTFAECCASDFPETGWGSLIKERRLLITPGQPTYLFPSPSLDTYLLRLIVRYLVEFHLSISASHRSSHSASQLPSSSSGCATQFEIASREVSKETEWLRKTSTISLCIASDRWYGTSIEGTDDTLHVLISRS